MISPLKLKLFKPPFWSLHYFPFPSPPPCPYLFSDLQRLQSPLLLQNLLVLLLSQYVYLISHFLFVKTDHTFSRMSLSVLKTPSLSPLEPLKIFNLSSWSLPYPSLQALLCPYLFLNSQRLLLGPLSWNLLAFLLLQYVHFVSHFPFVCAYHTCLKDVTISIEDPVPISKETLASQICTSQPIEALEPGCPEIVVPLSLLASEPSKTPESASELVRVPAIAVRYFFFF